MMLDLLSFTGAGVADTIVGNTIDVEWDGVFLTPAPDAGRIGLTSLDGSGDALSGDVSLDGGGAALLVPADRVGVTDVVPDAAVFTGLGDASLLRGAAAAAGAGSLDGALIAVSQRGDSISTSTRVNTRLVIGASYAM